MKTVTTTIVLFIALHSSGQANYHFDSSSKAIDSLFARLSTLANSVKRHDSSVFTPSSIYKFTIATYGGDSSFVSFFDQASQLLFRKVSKIDRQGCRWWELDEIYSLSGKLVYWEAQKWSCLKLEEKNDPDIMYFDALLYEKGRLLYDSLGRVKERVWWYTPLNAVRRYKYTYSQDNGRSYTMSKHDYESFWK